MNTPPKDEGELDSYRSGRDSPAPLQSTNGRLLTFSRERSLARRGNGTSLSSKIHPASTVSVRDGTKPSYNTAEAHKGEVPPPYKLDADTGAHANLFSNAHNINIGDNANITANAYNTIISHIKNSDIIKGLIIFVCLIAVVFSVLIPRLIPDTSGEDIMHRHLKPFVSFGAINGSNLHDPERQVHEGTRERAISNIKAWIDNPNVTSRILWLHGPPGVGKSAIAQTIINSYTIEKIPASFFFFRSDPGRNDGNRLFTTLSWKFASFIPAIKDRIIQSLIEQSDLATKRVDLQSQELIVRPFEALRNRTRKPQLSDMVVVIDGLDECSSPDLQKRILEIIGNIATNPLIPLRFFISSRPEAHINDTIAHFQNRTVSIDLVEYADADLDIEKYLKVKFDEIAKDQPEIVPATWPGQEIVQQLVYRASGQFMYASTVIGFVGDKDNSAKAQLKLVLGSKPLTTTEPFAGLDRLYNASLQWQTNEEFLKTFLALFVAKSLATPFHDTKVSCSYPYLDESLAILMDMSEEELRRKLRPMRSLFDDDHHPYYPSFLDFLLDQSRSGRFHICKDNAARQYFLSIIDLVIQSSFRVIEQKIETDYRPPVPGLIRIFGKYPTSFDKVLSSEDWQEALRRLRDVQDRLLNFPNFTVSRYECTIFHIVHRLVLSFSYRLILLDKAEESNRAVMPLDLMQKLRGGLSSVSTYFQRLKGMFDLMCTLLHSNPEVIAMRVRSLSEAQNLMNLICHIVNGNYLLTRLFIIFSADTARKATQLALEINTRVPVLPQFSVSSTYASGPYSTRSCRSCDLEALARVWLISNVLDHRYILPVLRIDVSFVRGAPPITLVSDGIASIQHWRESKIPSSNEIISIMLKIARAIQYFHSIGIVLSDTIDLDDIYVDLKFRVRISPMELIWSIYGRSLQEVGQRYETNINSFGHFFCTLYFGTGIESPCIVAIRVSPYKPELSVRHVWKLIERCLSVEGKPSINEVIQEMESWKVDPFV